MRQVERSELLDLGEYETIRSRFRARVMDLKEHRRVQVGDHMSMLFENHDTVLLQVQEMLRTERITDERGIAHELETYNELIPAPGSVSATLFIEYDDPAQRADMLRRFASLRDQLFVCVGDRRAQGKFTRHFGEEMDRLPAVNYVSFELGRDAAATLEDPAQPALIAVAHPDYKVEVNLSKATRSALAEDLK